ncbi:hypothetical protein CQA53_04090 [Helicobacter didelphidarum]|uniref:CN hydrolase domain-containing protein n=1 Tax=Helicobacter didelphidarum TaxID=2040648 RepID=A0A3D8IN20_9HELI|nr:hypothetical protein [Helicobacter didelphidarum]RDU66400.1 hypothetical protein CQA53_04090 [Helicobacter didelphidarum]
MRFFTRLFTKLKGERYLFFKEQIHIQNIRKNIWRLFQKNFIFLRIIEDSYDIASQQTQDIKNQQNNIKQNQYSQNRQKKFKKLKNIMQHIIVGICGALIFWFGFFSFAFHTSFVEYFFPQTLSVQQQVATQRDYDNHKFIKDSYATQVANKDSMQKLSNDILTQHNNQNLTKEKSIAYWGYFAFQIVFGFITCLIGILLLKPRLVTLKKRDFINDSITQHNNELLNPHSIKSQPTHTQEISRIKAKEYEQSSLNTKLNMLTSIFYRFFSQEYYIVYNWILLFIYIFVFSVLHNNDYVLVSIFYPISAIIFVFFPRQYRFSFGFFSGLFGFYWMTLSLRFNGLSEFIPLSMLCVGLVYAIFFWFLLYFENVFYRILACLSLFVLHPTGFNWLNIAYLSSYSIFNSSFFGLVCVLVFLWCVALSSKVRFLAPLFLLLAFDYNFEIQSPKLHAKIIETHYLQDERWHLDSQNKIIAANFKEIEKAISEGYEMVILPETSFTFVLNTRKEIYEKLLQLSENIIIFVGSIRLQSSDTNTQDSLLHTVQKNNILTNNPNIPSIKNSFFFFENLFIPSEAKDGSSVSLDMLKNQNIPFIKYDSVKQNDKEKYQPHYFNMPSNEEGFFNSTFIFAYGQSIVADKIALVPFGETLPLNTILGPIALWLFEEKFSFNEGKEVVKLEYNGLTIANANCYEGTMALPYQTGAKYIIMTSNNAWFFPSTQHLMQQMIIKYYARAYNAFVYHATNLTPHALVTPNNGGK